MYNKIETTINNINIISIPSLEGGGLEVYKDLVHVMNRKYPSKIFDNCFEWCSGSGTLGFTLLAHNFCKKITFGDIYPSAIHFVNMNIKNNNLELFANSFISDNFKSIPTNEKFDLIIGHPPHFSKDIYPNRERRKTEDPDWKIHEDFFLNAANYLTEDGIILLIEGKKGSSLYTFEPLIKNTPLYINDVFSSPTLPEFIWYLELLNKNSQS